MTYVVSPAPLIYGKTMQAFWAQKLDTPTVDLSVDPRPGGPGRAKSGFDCPILGHPLWGPAGRQPRLHVRPGPKKK